MTNWQITLHENIAAIGPDDWNRCAGIHNPLNSYEFLYALEASGSAHAETGWLPRHISLSDERGLIQGVVPLYVKSHSYGEYVFDHLWAHAWHRAGGEYYPKAQVAVPFSPVPGRRLMVDPALAEPDAADAFSALARGVIKATDTMQLSSLHITFLTESEATALRQDDPCWIMRQGLQFHWRNQGFDTFDDFLGLMSSRKRKTIRRERRDASTGLTYHQLTGDGIKPHHWDDFYRFYLTTIDKKWGGAYLTRAFFDAISQSMADRILLVVAEDSGRMIAAALNFIGEDTLYGRNWGCAEERPFLHFETCYYQAIDFAIARGLKTVEAGAQGLHKVQRGYAPALTYSAHYIPHPDFARVIGEFTRKEMIEINREAEELRRWSPYRRDIQNTQDS